MKYNTKTITLTTNSIHYLNIFCENQTKIKAESLAILLGEYNKYGRHIPLYEYKKILNNFEKLLFDMQKLYQEYK